MNILLVEGSDVVPERLDELDRTAREFGSIFAIRTHMQLPDGGWECETTYSFVAVEDAKAFYEVLRTGDDQFAMLELFEPRL